MNENIVVLKEFSCGFDCCKNRQKIINFVQSCLKIVNYSFEFHQADVDHFFPDHYQDDLMVRTLVLHRVIFLSEIVLIIQYMSCNCKSKE